jgi:hypothetical protein
LINAAAQYKFIREVDYEGDIWDKESLIAWIETEKNIEEEYGPITKEAQASDHILDPEAAVVSFSCSV